MFSAFLASVIRPNKSRQELCPATFPSAKPAVSWHSSPVISPGVNEQTGSAKKATKAKMTCNVTTGCYPVK